LSCGLGCIIPWALHRKAILNMNKNNWFYLPYIRLNRIYAMVLYVVYLFIIMAAIIEYAGREVYFYMPTFALSILSCGIGMTAALKRWLDIEHRTLCVCLVIGNIGFISNIIIMFDSGLNITLRTIIVLVLYNISLLNRLMCVRWIIHETQMFIKSSEKE